MDLGTSSQNGAEMAEQQLSILTCPAVVEFQCTLYPKGLFTRGALVPVLTVHLRITNRKSQVTSDRQILNLKYLICFLSFPFFKRAFNYTVVRNSDAVSSCHLCYKKKTPKTMLLCGCSSLPDIPLVQHTHTECLRSKTHLPEEVAAIWCQATMEIFTNEVPLQVCLVFLWQQHQKAEFTH